MYFMTAMLSSHVMEVSLFVVFRAVAECGSFTAAAQALGYTQSAVSRQVAALESEFGVTLFDRLPRGVRLTESGHCLLPAATAVASRLSAAREDLAALRSVAAGRLRAGAFPTADTALVPQAVSAFRALHPGVQLSFTEGFVRDLVVRLADGDLDVAIVTGTVPALLDGLELRHLMDDRMFVAVPAGHRFADRPVVRLGELAEEDWIAGSPRLEETLFAASGDGFTPRIRYVIREWVAKQGFVAAGLGVTLIPSLAAGSVRPDVVLVPLHADDSPVRKVFAATPAGVTPPFALAAFLGCLDRACTGLTGSVPACSAEDPCSAEEK
jgi:DNA-binding transcriptional LysR family regulator